MTLRIDELPPGWIHCPSTAELGGPAARAAWSEQLSRGLMRDWAALEPAGREAVQASFELGVRQADEDSAFVVQRRVPDTIAHVQLSLRELIIDDGTDIDELQLVGEREPLLGQPVVERTNAALLGDGVELRGVARLGSGDATVDVTVYRALFAGPGRLITVSMNPIPVQMVGASFTESAALLDLVRLVDADGQTPDLAIDRRVREAARTRRWGDDVFGSDG